MFSPIMLEPRTTWVGTWATGPQLIERGDLPPAPSLSNNTLRQEVYTSIGGEQVRVRISNEFGNGPVTLNTVHVAVSVGGGCIEPDSDRALCFGGAHSVTIPQGQAAFSDPLDFSLAPLAKIALTVHFGSLPGAVTGHPGSRTTSYIQSGQVAAAADLSGGAMTDHWYYITAIDVFQDSTAGAVVMLGDSISDGRGSTTDANDRWPDNLSRRLRAEAATTNVAVLNLGIGGNAVVSGGVGPTALERFERDVLNQRGVRWLIIQHGVNDIGSSSSSVAAKLISAYEQLIRQAHANNILVYGVPILPFGGSDYDSRQHEAARQKVNAFVRKGGCFDAVLDLDAAVRDPKNPENLLAEYDTGDHLHLNPAGYRQMAQAIDLTLFTR